MGVGNTGSEDEREGRKGGREGGGSERVRGVAHEEKVAIKKISSICRVCLSSFTFCNLLYNLSLSFFPKARKLGICAYNFSFRMEGIFSESSQNLEFSYHSFLK